MCFNLYTTIDVLTRDWSISCGNKLQLVPALVTLE